MEIEFETRAEDQQARDEANPPVSTWAYRGIQIGFFFLYAGPAVLPLFISRQWIAGSIFLTVYSGFWVWVMTLAKQRQPWIPPDGTLIRIRLSPEGLAELEPKASTWISWQLFESVTMHPSAVQLLLKSKGNVLIPTRVFASDEVRDQFVQLAQQYVAACPAEPTGEFPAADDPYLPAWTRGLSQSIEYQNDADQLAYVANGGLTPGKRSNIYLSSLFTSVFLLGSLAALVVGMLIVMATYDPSGRDFGGDAKVVMYFSSAAWFVSALVATSTMFRWIHRFRMHPSFLTPRQLTISSKGYLLRSATATLCGTWDNLSQVDQNEEFLALKNLDEQLICVVPKSVFPNPQMAQEFADEAILTWQEARQIDEAELVDDIIQAEVVDGDNPYRSPHA
ncbi:hypothetical protein [Blastopirellula marina]|uniref:YcxB-like protein domain-containing protein n=1 Tax=Blastopirellula marina TaxID=124 RepID=A0A2S8GGH2_9BACT|nr:hypothetical protein [Blastopirellula marina]PQO43567.1 hypothetical protein C5Y93_23240 [Blastopirellula marina]